MAADAAGSGLDDDIRKFEQIGTHPVPLILAIADALRFHDALNPVRKAARLVALRERWVQRLADEDRVVLNTWTAPGSAYGIANVKLVGIDTAGLQRHLWQKHGIYTITIRHRGVDADGNERGPDDLQYEGLRISPAVYTTPEELDRFGDVLEAVLRDGLPA